LQRQRQILLAGTLWKDRGVIKERMGQNRCKETPLRQEEKFFPMRVPTGRSRLLREH